MNCKILLLYILLHPLRTYTSLSVKKYVEQSELSEYCRRRAMPSMFLGKNVKDCNLNVLHFSRLEMPYSCMMSIRTESGNNIILVIKINSEVDLDSACAYNQDQLVVYELGETFGGYWGPIPKEIIVDPITITQEDKFYTLKTTKTQKTNSLETEKSSLATTTKTAQTKPGERAEEEYMTVEIPIVTISGNLQLPKLQDVADGLDVIYDVTPRYGEEYRTSMLPLVEFSLRKHTGMDGKDVLRNNRPVYDLDYSIYRGDGLTLDPRLTFSTAHRRFLTKKSNWSATKRLRFKHQRNKLFSRKTTSYSFFRGPRVMMRENAITPQEMVFGDDHTTSMNITHLATTNDYWYLFDNMMKSYNVTKNAERTENAAIAENLDNVYNIEKTNISAYLFSNLSSYVGHNLYDVSKNSSEPIQSPSIVSQVDSTPTYYDLNNNITTDSVSDLINLNASDEHIYSTSDNSHAQKKEKETSAVHNINVDKEAFEENTISLNFNNTDIINISDTNLNFVTRTNSTTTSIISRVPITGSLVDHESWENIVQVAPAMATALQSDDLENKNNSFSDLFSTLNNLSDAKKKRSIETLDIEKSRPRNLSSELPSAEITQGPYEFSDMQALAHLIEIEDDEIQGRVALSYLRNYIGPVLFNVCDHSEKQGSLSLVKLLNSSRVVFSFSNFTMERMLVTLTPALAMINNKAECPDSHLECQIMGTRVCIDSMNACDGVPNCGTNDIYDEDRLTCGLSSSTQYVFFATLAFLAVILTFMYTVHYCFTRCVPKVSEAFFIYTDNAENILYLDTIMQSPREDDDAGDIEKFYSPTQFDESDLMCTDIKKIEHVSKTRKLLRRFLNCILFKKNFIPNDSLEHQQLPVGTQKLPCVFSFTELELKKIIQRKDVITQTGESLEMKDIKIKKYIREKVSIESSGILNDVNINTDIDSYASELNLMKEVNKRKSTISDINMTGNMDKRFTKVINNETELHNTIYENKLHTSDNNSSPKTSYELPEDEESVEKHLRFEENPTFIPFKNNLLAVDSIHAIRPSTSHTQLDRDKSKKVSKPMKRSGSPFRIWNSSKTRKHK